MSGAIDSYHREQEDRDTRRLDRVRELRVRRYTWFVTKLTPAVAVLGLAIGVAIAVYW